VTIDCAALRLRYQTLDQAYLDLLSGKRKVQIRNGDDEITYAQVNLGQLRDARDAIAAELQTRCGDCVAGMQATRFAQPAMSDGRNASRGGCC
jgi:gpW